MKRGFGPKVDEILEDCTLVTENSYSRIFRREANAVGEAVLLRLSSTDGLCEVYQSGSRYVFLRRLLTPEECTEDLGKPFIELCLDLVPQLKGGRCIQMFAGLGGIICVERPEGPVYFRVSITRGIQKVRKGLERWRTLEYVCSGVELKQLLTARQSELKPLPAEGQGVENV